MVTTLNKDILVKEFICTVAMCSVQVSAHLPTLKHSKALHECCLNSAHSTNMRPASGKQPFICREGRSRVAVYTAWF